MLAKMIIVQIVGFLFIHVLHMLDVFVLNKSAFEDYKICYHCVNMIIFFMLYKYIVLVKSLWNVCVSIYILLWYSHFAGMNFALNILNISRMSVQLSIVHKSYCKRHEYWWWCSTCTLVKCLPDVCIETNIVHASYEMIWSVYFLTIRTTL